MNRPPRALRPARRHAFRALAIAFGIGIFVLLGEFGIRLRLAWLFRGQLEEVSREIPADPNATVTLGDLVYPVENDNLIYRLKPGAAGVFRGAPVRVNSLGFRDEEIGPLDASMEAPLNAKPPGTIRIIALGDSLGFGWGVEAEEGFFELIEKDLDRLAGKARRVQVINTSVPGYNAVMEAEILHETGLALEPDAVLIEYCTNDEVLPDFLMRKPFFRRLDRLYLLRLGGLLTGSLARDQRETARLSPPGILYHPRPDGPGAMDPRDVPPRYRHHVGPQPLEAAYRRIRNACRERGIPLIVVAPSAQFHEGDPTIEADPMMAGIRSLCVRLEAPLIETFGAIRRHIETHGLHSIDLSVEDPQDWHPNALHHELIAREMLGMVSRELGLESNAERGQVSNERH